MGDVKRVRRSKKQQYLDAKAAAEKTSKRMAELNDKQYQQYLSDKATRDKRVDDAKTLMQIAYQAWQSELEQMKNEFDEIGKPE